MGCYRPRRAGFTHRAGQQCDEAACTKDSPKRLDAVLYKYLCTGREVQRDASSARCASIKVCRLDIGVPAIGKAERELPVPASISLGQRARTGMSSAIFVPRDTCTFATMRANRPPVRLSDIRPDRSRVDPAEKRVHIRRDRSAKLGTLLLLLDP
jgi:hypothetical protein